MGCDIILIGIESGDNIKGTELPAGALCNQKKVMQSSQTYSYYLPRHIHLAVSGPWTGAGLASGSSRCCDCNDKSIIFFFRSF